MMRQCDRTGCADLAAATLSYDYAERAAWLVDLTDAPHPATYELCHRHADGLNVPMGWALHDQRRVVMPLFDTAQAS
jgi:hypothetical protein